MSERKESRTIILNHESTKFPSDMSDGYYKLELSFLYIDGVENTNRYQLSNYYGYICLSLKSPIITECCEYYPGFKLYEFNTESYQFCESDKKWYAEIIMTPKN